MKIELETVRVELWDRLARLFARHQESRDLEVPFGFATRVAARWQEMRRYEQFRAWELLSIRAAIGCSAVALVCSVFLMTDDWRATSQDVLVVPPAVEADEVAVLVP